MGFVKRFSRYLLNNILIMREKLCMIIFQENKYMLSSNSKNKNEMIVKRNSKYRKIC